MADQEIRIQDYFRVAQRRKLQFLIPFVLVMGAAIAMAFLLPATYRSDATMLIERQSIPTDLVDTTVTGYVQENIQQITQRLLTHKSLLGVANEFNLYQAEIQRSPQDVVLGMRDAFEVEMLDVQATDPDKVGTRQATIAFSIAFSAPTAEAARDITAHFADRYLEEHEAQRNRKAAEVREFLQEQASRKEQEILQMEEELAEFKVDEFRTLPEMKEMNLKLYEKTEEQIEEARDRIRELEDKINSLNAELAVTPAKKNVRTDEGGELLSAQDRLNSLIAQYVRATSRYSAKHPDVIRLSREIRTLADQAGSAGRADEMMNELVSLQEQLRQAQQRYAADHPDVVRLEKSVASLQRGFQNAIASGQSSAAASAPDNPRYVSLLSEIRGSESSLQAERNRLGRAQVKLEEYEERLFATPDVERKYQRLSRDYKNAVDTYEDLKNKQLEAELAENLESGESGEQFLLSSPAYLPSLPDSPNRIGIFLLGIMLATLIGIISAAIAEFSDKAVYDSRTISSLLGAPPLAVIPRINK